MEVLQPHLNKTTTESQEPEHEQPMVMMMEQPATKEAPPETSTKEGRTEALSKEL